MFIAKQIIINIREDGFLTKLSTLKLLGWKTLWAGNGMICLYLPGKEEN